MSTTNTKQIKNTMISFVAEYTDSRTGEIDCTKLAEETCCALNLYEGDDIPEYLFEMAFEVAS